MTVVEDSDLTFARRLEALENAKIAPPSLVETFNALPPPPPLEDVYKRQSLLSWPTSWRRSCPLIPSKPNLAPSTTDRPSAGSVAGMSESQKLAVRPSHDDTGRSTTMGATLSLIHI